MCSQDLPQLCQEPKILLWKAGSPRSLPLPISDTKNLPLSPSFYQGFHPDDFVSFDNDDNQPEAGPSNLQPLPVQRCIVDPDDNEGEDELELELEEELVVDKGKGKTKEKPLACKKCRCR